MSTVSENGNSPVKVKSRRDPNHFMVGKRVSIDGFDVDGEIASVIEHTVDHEVYRRVLVKLDDGREINVGSSDVEVLS